MMSRPMLLTLLLALVLSGCVLAPRGTETEVRKNRAAGANYHQPPEERQIPELPRPAEWRDVLHRAFLANGDLEASYFEWSAALARIPQEAVYPNTNLAPSFSYMFSSERMKSWDRTTVNLGFDPMENLQLPNKVAQRGKVALQGARAAGARFEAAKFDLQRKVLTAYLDLALMDQRIRIQQNNVELLRLISDTASSRVQAGGNQVDLLRAQTQHRLAESELATMRSESAGMKAMLNGMLARAADAPIVLPSAPPTARLLAADDARLIAVAIDQNPELARLAHEVAGRKDALELARLAYLPDVNPMAAFTGSVSQMAGAMIVLPTTFPRIRGMIDEQRAMLQASEAILRQTRSDRAGQFVAALYAVRNAERQTELFENSLLPLAEQSLASSRQVYTTGAGTFIDLIDSQRTLLDVRLLIAQVRIDREKRLAEMEALAGIDIETLAPPTTAPAPTTLPAPASKPTEP